MELTLAQLAVVFAVPSSITGLVVWWLKRKIEENEKKAREHESNLESLVLMMMESTRANTVGITAIAKAVQRIPDAHCNGDMSAALEQMEQVQEKEQQFIMDKGIKYLFE